MCCNSEEINHSLSLDINTRAQIIVFRFHQVRTSRKVSGPLSIGCRHAACAQTRDSRCVNLSKKVHELSSMSVRTWTTFSERIIFT